MADAEQAWCQFQGRACAVCLQQQFAGWNKRATKHECPWHRAAHCIQAVLPDKDYCVRCHHCTMQDCDPALLRRFSRRIEVPLPDIPAREHFFQTMLSCPELNSNLSTEDIGTLVQLTAGYSGSDLADLCRTAALAPVRELMKQQRLQLGRKRRRNGLGFGPPYTICTGSRQSDESCAPAGSPSDSTACTGLSAANQQGTVVQGASAAADPGCLHEGTVEHAVHAQAGGAAEVQLRALVLGDFQSALELVKPAAVDAADS